VCECYPDNSKILRDLHGTHFVQSGTLVHLQLGVQVDYLTTNLVKSVFLESYD
jgi:hypothetical protein